MMITNILLSLIILLFSIYLIVKVFIYFKNIKDVSFKLGVHIGSTNAMKQIIKHAKKGESFDVSESESSEKIKLIIVNNEKK